ARPGRHAIADTHLRRTRGTAGLPWFVSQRGYHAGWAPTARGTRGRVPLVCFVPLLLFGVLMKRNTSLSSRTTVRFRPKGFQPRVELLEDRLPPGDAVFTGLLGTGWLLSGQDAIGSLSTTELTRPALDTPALETTTGLDLGSVQREAQILPILTVSA